MLHHIAAQSAAMSPATECWSSLHVSSPSLAFLCASVHSGQVCMLVGSPLGMMALVSIRRSLSVGLGLACSVCCPPDCPELPGACRDRDNRTQ